MTVEKPKKKPEIEIIDLSEGFKSKAEQIIESQMNAPPPAIAYDIGKRAADRLKEQKGER
jgi:hypothetical protein